MRLIFSRKGFDSASGGGPSPLLAGRPRSLPIPTKMPTSTRFHDVGDGIASQVARLSGGRIAADRPCHLDPDLDPAALPRQPGWRGALGQAGAAQSHLRNQGVTIGDVFLFWGLFQENSGPPDWRFRATKEHRIFGWLQIGEVWTIADDPQALLAAHPWLSAHPHVQAGGWPRTNTVYVASKTLTLDGERTALPGWGLLRTGFRFTARGSGSPSQWRVPSWLDITQGGVGLTYHPPARWQSGGRLQSAARGQEFVAD
ncbi:MAG: hypothetical protein EXR82_11290, partial [Gammaproteobacteria bacterium]|nr:hypothetical protein [Gammaproteobacteria bacterium]